MTNHADSSSVIDAMNTATSDLSAVPNTATDIARERRHGKGGRSSAGTVMCAVQRTHRIEHACPRRRKEMARTEQARQNRPVFDYETDDTGRSIIGASIRTQEHVTIRSTSPIGIQENTSTLGSS
ncbi:hypothetical protein BDV30DRAFT_202485 [Aspergillus minisclerotigenes]|uniref:Uncharacterized protein n=1 Tax=Aspergillus minisclerotigenes TaxID=656917 RepID=A0A5N6JLV1_9EURO|nr:hypothetical protein BDV30DRAFT_202485 [Aspergillus minisclerotigenes]